MPMARYPPPSGSAERVREYLEIAKAAQEQNGFIKPWDFFKKAYNQIQANRMLKNFVDWGFFSEDPKGVYHLTKNGEDMLEILRNRRLVGLLTGPLSGDHIKKW